ncbi:endonuclease Q family protein [Patescibacteria group bacterium]|nr:endonuclease Q family protein [Patescibacteria group bacterium]
MKKILDLHIHSKYSRACSRDLELHQIAKACEIRGIDIVATGDFTHPKWFESIREELVEVEEGIYSLKDTRNKDTRRQTNSKLKIKKTKTRFILGTELAVIKKHKDKTRRLHLCVYAPNLEVAEKFNKKLADGGFNLSSDGRPILGMTGRDLLEFMLEVDDRMTMIPAHAWTPWFGVFGSKSGYDSLEDAFEDLTPHIFAIETGLSSDPLMNWRCSWLDNITMVSNSDAHSTAKLGREANVLNFDSEDAVDYNEIMKIIKKGDKKNFLQTIEFYPEEGKYHMDGHRDCKFVCNPHETKKLGGICPICKKKLVIGVMNRVDELADRTEKEAYKVAKEKEFIPYKSLVPLSEILADTFGCGVKTKRVASAYNELTHKLGNEFHILLNSSLPDIVTASSDQIADAIDRVRKGNIVVRPGYDGEFGVVKVFEDNHGEGGVKQAGFDLELPPKRDTI